MSFLWYCKQSNETFLRNPNKREELLYANGSFLPKEKISQSEIDENKARLGLDFQEGGCFGNGPGIVTISEMFILLMWLGGKYLNSCPLENGFKG